MDQIRVSFGALDAGRQSIGATVAHVDQQLADLKAYVAPLVADWSGAASEQYQARQQQVDQAWADLNALLAQIGGHVDAANASYQATERANVGRWT